MNTKNDTAKLELISFNVCPFVQRSVITLLEKAIECKLTYIDLNNPPSWFTKISPLGKVPVLKVGTEVLFESADINEYLDEVNLPAMTPDDALIRAKSRAWIEFGSDMIMNHYHMTAAQDSAGFSQYRDQLITQFIQLEKTLGQGPYFNGSDLSLVDTAFAPLFMRIDLLEEYYPLSLYQPSTLVNCWRRELAALTSVKNSVTSSFEGDYLDFIKSLNSYYSTLVKGPK